jgi:hypothetical protein
MGHKRGFTVSINGGSGFFGTTSCPGLKRNGNVHVCIGDKVRSMAFPELSRVADVRSVDALRAAVPSNRSANPSFASLMKLRLFRYGHQPTRRDEHGTTADGALPGAGGGVSAFCPAGERVRTG